MVAVERMPVILSGWCKCVTRQVMLADVGSTPAPL